MSLAGVHSPTFSGSSQLDAYRPLFLPTILIGDSKLGGISATISAYESLLLRGYIVDSVLIFKDDYYHNWEYLTSYFAEKDILVSAVPPPPARDTDPYKDLLRLKYYYHIVTRKMGEICSAAHHLSDKHEKRIQELESMPSRTLSHVWWPFVQHNLVNPDARSVTVIDSANKDFFSVFNGEGPEVVESSLTDEKSILDWRFDGSASWWTQALGHSHLSLTLAAARASGRYGHVMFPQATHLPALNLMETLLSSKGPGHGWANRVFFSDDGSTGIEVALKMALRAYSKRFGVHDNEKKNLGVLGLKGSYHGDTIGAMNACESGDGVYTCEWHDAKGFWFDPPTLSIRKGKVIMSLPKAISDIVEAEGDTQLLGGFSRNGDRGELGMGPALSPAYDVGKRIQTKLAEMYAVYVQDVLKKLDESGVKLAALILEPLLMGAAGMVFVDPLFQRVLIDVVRSRDSEHYSALCKDTWRGMPVIFDEVFVGMYRLGCLSTSSILGTYPDISVHAKMLTGGLVPLSVTLAKESIFEAFLGEKKDQALLHGHSYTAYPVGCEVANEALKQMDKLVDGPGWIQAQTEWGKVNTTAAGVKEEYAQDIWSFWGPGFVDMLSRLKGVAGVMAMGTVLVIRVHDEGRGKLIHPCLGDAIVVG
jgi:bifunctional dethiobiotin synthetase / adenosylmethionine---8-amino-7-oxononanoate aminotransferase